ncbi:MAG: ABC transporter substrate-binding protein, partial [Limnochordales bacterium]
ALEGVRFAVDEINRQGGIAGRQVEVVPFDDQGDPFRAQQGVDRLATQGIRFIVSGSSSAGALGQVPRAYENRVVMITPLGSDPAITQRNLEYEGDPWFFANIPSNDDLGRSIARYAAQELNVRQVAVFVRDDAYGLTIAAAFEDEARAHGMTVTRRVTYPVTAQDFSSDLAVVLASRPDAIFLSGYAPDSALIARQARMLGFTGPLLATNPVMSPQYVGTAGAAAQRTFVSTALNVGQQRSEAEERFWSDWRASHGTDPNVYQLGSYDSVYLLKQAIEQAGFDPGAVRSWLVQVKEYPGVSGTITFNRDGSVTKPVYIVEHKTGRWEYVGTIYGR